MRNAEFILLSGLRRCQPLFLDVAHNCSFVLLSQALLGGRHGARSCRELDCAENT